MSDDKPEPVPCASCGKTPETIWEHFGTFQIDCGNIDCKDRRSCMAGDIDDVVKVWNRVQRGEETCSASGAYKHKKGGLYE